MKLIREARDVCDVNGFERRAAELGNRPALVWFQVPVGTPLDLSPPYELIDEETSKPVQLLDYEPMKGVVIAIEADALHIGS